MKSEWVMSVYSKIEFRPLCFVELLSHYTLFYTCNSQGLDWER